MREQLLPPPERELGSTDIEAWIPTRTTELGRTLEPFVIYDSASYQVYLREVMEDVTYKLGKGGLATVCCIVNAQKDSIIERRDVVNFFSAVLGL